MITPESAMNQDPSSTPAKGPWIHRFAVRILSILFGLLLYWLLGFIIRDIGTVPGPDWATFQQAFVPNELIQQRLQLEEQLTETNRQISNLSRKRDLLSNSVHSFQQTINQLLALQQTAVENDRPLDERNSEILQSSLSSFLKTQQDAQALNEQLLAQEAAAAGWRDQITAVTKEIQQKETPAHQTFSDARKKHSYTLAAYKLAALLPILLLAGWLFVRLRSSRYFEPVLAFAIAVLIKIGFVMHEHFPARIFRYLLVVSSLIVVMKVLQSFIKGLNNPKGPWLLKQYRDAYERFLCPVCEFPIRRGPLRFRYWTRRSIKKLILARPSASEQDQDPAYTCPACGTELFITCHSCGMTRHAMLPFCDHCGSQDHPQATAGSAT